MGALLAVFWVGPLSAQSPVDQVVTGDSLLDVEERLRAAREAYFEGTGTEGSAFPGPLTSAEKRHVGAAVDARIDELEALAAETDAEREGDGELESALAASQALEERWLREIRLLIETYPALSAESLAPLRAAYKDAARVPSDPDSPEPGSNFWVEQDAALDLMLLGVRDLAVRGQLDEEGLADLRQELSATSIGRGWGPLGRALLWLEVLPRESAVARLLGAGVRQAIDEALVVPIADLLAEEALPPASAAVDPAAAAAAAARWAVRQEHLGRWVLPELSGGLSALAQQRIQEGMALMAARETAWRQWAARGGSPAPALVAAEAEQRAVAAQEALEAEGVAEDPRSQELDTLLERDAELLRRRLDAERAFAEREHARTVEQADFLRELGSRRVAAEQLSSLDPTRRAQSERLWEESEALAEEVRGRMLRLLELREVGLPPSGDLSAARALVAGEEDLGRRRRLEQRLADWKGVFSQQVLALEGHRQSRLEEERLLVSLFLDTGALREQLRTLVPRPLLEQEADRQLERVRKELSVVEPILRTWAAGNVGGMQGVRSVFRDLDAMWGISVGGFWVLLGLLLWRWLRSRVDEFIAALLLRESRRPRRLYRPQVEELRAPLLRLGLSAVDLLSIWILLLLLDGRLPVLWLLLRLTQLWLLFRFCQALAALALADRSSPRPALWTLGTRSRQLALGGVRSLLSCLLLGWALNDVVRALLGAVALADLLNRVFAAFLFALFMLLLHRSAPTLQLAVAREVPGGGWLDRVVGPDHTSPLLGWLRGGICLVVLVLLAPWRILQGRVSEDTVLGRSLNLLYRKQLGRAEEGPTRRLLPRAVRRALRFHDPVEETSGEHRELVSAANGAWEGWLSERGRGLVVVVGEPGQGRHRWARRWAESTRAGASMPLVAGSFKARCDDAHEVLDELGRLFDLDASGGLDVLDAHLKSLPPSVLLIEAVEWGMLRRVGGFEGIRQLYQLIEGNSARHFWVLCFHAPTWHYLSRLANVVNPDACRAVLRLPRLGSLALRNLVVGATSAAGYRVDFSRLAQEMPLGGDPVDELERATAAFFRLLAEASAGNPGVALALFQECLAPAEEEGALEVGLSRALADPRSPELSDFDLLNLAAIRVHGRLALDELVQVCNLPVGPVQSSIRSLVARGLVIRKGGSYRFALEHAPALHRELRQRHFVYGGE